MRTEDRTEASWGRPGGIEPLREVLPTAIDLVGLVRDVLIFIGVPEGRWPVPVYCPAQPERGPRGGFR